MCVATVSDKTIVEDVLARLGIYDYFSAILTSSEVGFGKDTPHLYRAALKTLGTSKEETAVFEDVLHALTTAKQDGFITVAVYDSHESRQIEMKALADYYIADYKEARI